MPDYVLEGQDGTDYEGGYYHGKIIFPPQYPFKPPSILMLTPSGTVRGSRVLQSSPLHTATSRLCWPMRLNVRAELTRSQVDSL